MEVIDISGYSLQEKLQISRRYLLPKQVKENGLKDDLI
jgi:ATP-dependent Lon protease